MKLEHNINRVLNVSNVASGTRFLIRLLPISVFIFVNDFQIEVLRKAILFSIHKIFLLIDLLYIVKLAGLLLTQRYLGNAFNIHIRQAMITLHSI